MPINEIVVVEDPVAVQVPVLVIVTNLKNLPNLHRPDIKNRPKVRASGIEEDPDPEVKAAPGIPDLSRKIRENRDHIQETDIKIANRGRIRKDTVLDIILDHLQMTHIPGILDQNPNHLFTVRNNQCLRLCRILKIS